MLTSTPKIYNQIINEIAIYTGTLYQLSIPIDSLHVDTELTIIANGISFPYEDHPLVIIGGFYYYDTAGNPPVFSEIIVSYDVNHSYQVHAKIVFPKPLDFASFFELTTPYIQFVKIGASIAPANLSIQMYL